MVLVNNWKSLNWNFLIKLTLNVCQKLEICNFFRCKKVFGSCLVFLADKKYRFLNGH